jgi:hypothetical protein
VRGRQEKDAVLVDGKIDTGAHCNAIKKVWCSSPTVPFFGKKYIYCGDRDGT